MKDSVYDIVIVAGSKNIIIFVSENINIPENSSNISTTLYWVQWTYFNVLLL